MNRESSNASYGIATVKKLTKLEKLIKLPKDSVMEYYDLSDDSLQGIPDLSGYTILSLNLSHNQIDTIIAKNLPQKVEKLNLSHNNFVGYIKIYQNTISYLKEIDMSYNKLSIISIEEPVYRALLSHNELTDLFLYQLNLCYLDISYNPNFSNKTFTYIPDKIDTIIRVGIANDKPLYNPMWYNGGYHVYSADFARRKALEEQERLHQ